MSSYRALGQDDEPEPLHLSLDESRSALLRGNAPGSPSKSKATSRSPLKLFLLFGLGALLLGGLKWLWSGVSRPRYSTEGLRTNGAAFKAAHGPWASTGDSWAPTSGSWDEPADLMSNGTHRYRKTVLLISLDGVRADYLTKGLTPHLLDVADQGIRAEYLESIFPTLTFPNHWSILTGLYAESHGIVGNDFYDPATQRSFMYQDPARSWSASWWGGEPVWATAERQGVKSAVLMWPGPPALTGGLQPSRWYAFEDMFFWQKKTELIERWLDMPLESRPQFIAAYLPEVDQDGHRTGPLSDVVEDRLRYVDDFAKSIHLALAARNLLDIVDVFFVSDHGMTETSNERLIYLDDLLGSDWDRLISRDGWPSAGLRFDASVDPDRILSHLETEAAASHGAFKVYTSSTMPPEWHFSSSVNERIAPIYVVPAVGWSITHRAEMQAMNETYTPVGNHGYDPQHPDMRAFFVAHGPWAKRIARRGQSPIPGFKNIELDQLFTRLLDLEPAPNNGTGGFWDRYF